MYEYMNHFAWNYAEMTGLNPEIAMHRLNIANDVKSVNQGQRRTNLAIMNKIEKEVLN